MSEVLDAQLDRARSLGFLGPGPIADHIQHAAGFVDALVGIQGRVVDLGSGGGIPGLLLAEVRPDLELVLVDAAAKRCRFLEDAVNALGVGETVMVVQGRAEVVGHGPLRGTADAVVARSFGPPAPTAECAAPLLRLGGRLIVSEPPDGPPRWPAAPLLQLGLVTVAHDARGPRVQVLELERPCPVEYPRRDGIPAKRPLF